MQLLETTVDDERLPLQVLLFLVERRLQAIETNEVGLVPGLTEFQSASIVRQFSLTGLQIGLTGCRLRLAGFEGSALLVEAAFV